MYKIRKAKTINHPILGDFSIDFTKDDGSCFDTIIFAGENGTGKTTILEFLTLISSLTYDGTNQSLVETESIEIEVEVDNNIYVLKSVSSDVKRTMCAWHSLDGIRLQDGIQKNDNRRLNTILSDVEINFNYAAIKHATTETIDETQGIAGVIRPSRVLSNEIAQLFVDIAQLDNNDIADWIKEHPGAIPSLSQVDIRMSRFKRAFDYMFSGNLNYKKIADAASSVSLEKRKEIIFAKKVNGIEVEVFLNKLSSGEKQIVFRSAFLLRRKEALLGCIVLIDEPEISMHPKWQEKLLGFTQNLFRNDTHVQTSQIFLATHSDHILKSALESDNTLIVKLFSNSSPERIYRGQTGAHLPVTTLGEVKWRIFDVPTVDYHIELFGELHDRLKNLPQANVGDKMISVDSWMKANGAPEANQLDGTPLPSVSNPKYTPETTLPVYIRNYIHHPEHANGRSRDCLEQLESSILYLISKLNSLP